MRIVKVGALALLAMTLPNCAIGFGPGRDATEDVVRAARDLQYEMRNLRRDLWDLQAAIRQAHHLPERPAAERPAPERSPGRHDEGRLPDRQAGHAHPADLPAAQRGEEAVREIDETK